MLAGQQIQLPRVLRAADEPEITT